MNNNGLMYNQSTIQQIDIKFDMNEMVIPPFLIELIGRKSKALIIV